MKVRLRPQAERELLAVAEFYAREGSPAIVRRFFRDFGRVTALLEDQPSIGSPRNRDRRGLAMSTFHYTVVYWITGDEIMTLLVKHNHRRPGFGAGRT
ncbi:MAG: type II toxin-antitoxin system RelE/ParE family toxin [Acidobacteriaceae bacterium]|nr:type II toxin-antitoxin system RelE/ParE family toxin [Acidobacteriaceae bacterium]